MNASAFWALCPTFSIVQAAFLFCGKDPSNIDSQSEHQSKYHPIGYIPVKTALFNAVKSGRLEAQKSFDYYGEDGMQGELNIFETQIARGDLDEFFDNGGVTGQFFGKRFHNAVAASGTAQMPLKLNAALKAWAAVSSDPLLVRGKSPKQALKAWLVEHADDLGLRKRDGQLNEAGIEEICKVANWRPEGGATPTPEPLPPPLAPMHAESTDFSTYDPNNLDDGIPF